MKSQRTGDFGSSFRRFAAIARAQFLYIIARPLFLIWIAVIVLLTYYLIESGMTYLPTRGVMGGGQRVVVTSEFAVADDAALMTILISSFFVSIIAGLSPIDESEMRVGAILHATPLRISEYVWGNLAGILASVCTVVLCHIGAMLLLYHAVPMPDSDLWRGPLQLSNYLLPSFLFTLPCLFFLATVNYAVGNAFRQPILVFVLPCALITGYLFYIALSSEHAADTAQTIALFDPSGYAWLRETYFLIDRGVVFYNTARIEPTATFLMSRIALVLGGLVAVGLAQLRVARIVRSPAPYGSRRAKSVTQVIDADLRARMQATMAPANSASVSLTGLKMRGGRPGIWRPALAVARVELAAMRRQPGTYVFALLIAFVTESRADTITTIFGMRRILTVGYVATAPWGILVILLAMLLLSYTVEILERDRTSGVAALANATPARTSATLLGKFLALCIAVILPLFATAVLLQLLILSQRSGVSLAPGPFYLLWGAVLGPSLIAWIAFIMALYVLAGDNRFAAYAWGGLALILISVRGKAMGWVGNGFLLGTLRWTDMAPFEFDRTTLVLSRLLAISVGIFCFAVVLTAYRRREPDLTRGRALANVRGRGRALLGILPFALLPIGLTIYLQTQIGNGDHGGEAEQKARDYWQRNVGTWPTIPEPGITDVVLSLDLHPAQRAYSASGALTLTNYHRFPLTTFALTPILSARRLRWILPGGYSQPQNRAGLYVFTPRGGALAPGQSVRVDFSYDVPDPGPTKNGVGNITDRSSREFVVPSAVVLTSFSNRLIPEVGYDLSIGVDSDNTYDARDPTITSGLQEPGAHLFGSQTPFSLKLIVSGPSDFTLNGVGTHMHSWVFGDRRTDEWDSMLDPAAPIRCFGLIGGRNLQERHGVHDTVIYYYKDHTYNIDSMLEAMDAAQDYYGAWFAPYPYGELKLTEYPDFLGLAQGLPTNITFSEGMGFLTRPSDSEFKATTDAFAFTAHETAHQWWGNLVMPGNGPGGNVLSEGLAHYSTAMLLEQVKVWQARQKFLEHIEWVYNHTRSPDNELPIARMSGDARGDQTVTYDKGGWVFWMLSENVMGRDNMLRGLRAYVAKYRVGNYRPGIPDILATLRPFAPGKPAFDAFVDQWFYHVIVPEFQITHAKSTRSGWLGWDVSCDLQNIGSGRIETPIAIFGSGGRRALFTRTLDAKDARAIHFTFPVDFEPTSIYVDPWRKILQRNRVNAYVKLPVSGATRK